MDNWGNSQKIHDAQDVLCDAWRKFMTAATRENVSLECSEFLIQRRHKQEGLTHRLQSLRNTLAPTNEDPESLKQQNNEMEYILAKQEMQEYCLAKRLFFEALERRIEEFDLRVKEDLRLEKEKRETQQANYQVF